MIWLGLIVLIGLVALGLRGFISTLQEQPAKAIVLAGLVFVAVFFVASLGDSGLVDMAKSDQMERVLRMLATVAISVGVCIGVWVLLNLAVGQAERRWAVFSGLAAGVGGAIFGGLLRGNKSVHPLVAEEDPLLLFSGGGWLGLIEWPLAGALVFGFGTFLAKSVPSSIARVAIGAGVGAGAGALIASQTKVWQRPAMDWLPALGWGDGSPPHFSSRWTLPTSTRWSRSR